MSLILLFLILGQHFLKLQPYHLKKMVLGLHVLFNLCYTFFKAILTIYRSSSMVIIKQGYAPPYYGQPYHSNVCPQVIFNDHHVTLFKGIKNIIPAHL